MKDIAAHNLEGLTLKSGWKVIKKREKKAGDTGGTFSVCYDVEKDSSKYFMKAFNINAFINNLGSGKSWTEYMQEMTKAYLYEKDLSEYCQTHNVTKVSFVIDSGEEFVNGYTFPIVPYLIFNMANGDIRHALDDYSDKIDFSWKLKSLHDVAVAIKQLHSVGVSHQDIKPSNILLFDDESKLGDLGRSMCPTLNGPYDKFIFSGDYTYAPPEIIYNNCSIDWTKRTYATDCYLLGSMIVYYITNVSMTSLLFNNMCKNPDSSFDNDEVYLIEAFQKSLIEIKKDIPIASIKDDAIQLIEYLCYPNPQKRGHPKNILSKGNNYSLERFVTNLDLLKRKTELELIKSTQNGTNI